MELDEVFRYLGNWGRHQTFIFIFMNIFCCVFPGWLTMSVIFFTADPEDYHCTPPEGYYPNETIPGLVDGDGVDRVDKCNMYVVDNEGIVTGNLTTCLNGWDYETTVTGETTMITDFDLVCDKSLLAEIAASLFMGGVLVGALPIGQIPDIVGRKPVFFVSLIVEVVVGVGLVFAWNYYAILVLWVLAGMFREGLFATGFCILMEMYVPEKRALVGSLLNVIWGISMTTLAGVAYIFPNWRHMQLFMSLILLLALPFYKLTQESVRWLISQGRIEEAEDVLQYVAKFNKISSPPKRFLQELDELKLVNDQIGDEHKTNLQIDDDTKEVHKTTKGGYDKLYDQTKETNQRESKKSYENKYDALEDEKTNTKLKQHTFLDLFRTPVLLKISMILFVNCFANSIVYYGLSLDSSHLAGNKYLNFFLLGLVEIPAYICAYISMEKVGRRLSMVVTLIIAGVACIITACTPETTDSGESLRPLIITFAMIGKFMISYSFAVLFIYTPELMPTVVRNAGLGLVSFALRVGGVLAPYVIYLERVGKYLPLTILGIISIVAGILSILLPETRNRPLPETIEDGEKIYQTKAIPRERMLSIVPSDFDK
ncbi:organic cation transporter protein-like [Amphiura filiformis]|uniref:organic cation transporter protein-like n=1 Tax=Amphiura filiformis TaxID=82378 RepID=UPI003B2153F4